MRLKIYGYALRVWILIIAAGLVVGTVDRLKHPEAYPRASAGQEMSTCGVPSSDEGVRYQEENLAMGERYDPALFVPDCKPR